eukprot:jgi/Hompol1/6592/HPOL_003166-RA
MDDIDALVRSIEELPEVHSTVCAEQKKRLTQTEAKKDALLMNGLAKRDAKTGSTSSQRATVARERTDAKNRLHEQLGSASKTRKKKT